GVRLVGVAGEVRRYATVPSPGPSMHVRGDPRRSTGEQVTIGLLAMALKAAGIAARSYTGAQVTVHTDSAYTKARIMGIDDAKIKKDLDAGRAVVITGFQGVDPQGNVTTLGRGGSDTSAVAVAAALKADECLIYTDVDGVYTTDPRVCEDARRLDHITFEEMLEMASLGSKVLQIRSVEFAGKYKVKTRVLSSLTDPLIPLDQEMKSGTLITFEEDTTMEAAVISGIAFARDEAKITVIDVPDRPGIAYQILGPIAEANIDVDMIIQNQSVEGKTDFTFTVPRADYQKALDLLKKSVQAHIGAKDIMGDPKVSKVSVVGVGMRSHVGVASKMFRTLSEEGINILMISTSEIKISVVIDEKYMELAVRALHKAFELDQK
ncbi:MAG: hypothetical protein RLZZ539_1430, partial [Pseudomonadota bacterium]